MNKQDAGKEEGIIELIDEDGKTARFQHIVTVDYEENEYALLVPEEEADQDEQGVIILKIVPGGENQEDLYEGVEDETILNAVFEEFQKMLEESEDFSD